MALPARLALCLMSVVFLAGNASFARAQTRPAAPAGAAPVAPGAVMSESKFLGALYSEIEKHTPAETTLGDGEVTASFHVNASGRIDRVRIDKTSSPAHAEAVKQILGAVVAPPPPGGAMDVGQTFKFHKSEPDEAVVPSAPSSSPATSPAPPAMTPKLAPKPAPTAAPAR
jgi:TonB family protein